jgi:beta-aspartyl-peptidase (threonine type)
MKRCTLLLAAGMALACQSTPVLPDPAELTDVVYVQEAAWNDGDLEGFMAGSYWRSDALTFLSGGDWTRGYATVLERYRRRYLEGGAEMGRLSFTDLEAEGLAEDVGLVRGRWTLTFSDGSTTSGLFTLVMRRMFEGWRVVHDHTSVDQPGT